MAKRNTQRPKGVQQFQEEGWKAQSSRVKPLRQSTKRNKWQPLSFGASGPEIKNSKNTFSMLQDEAEPEDIEIPDPPTPLSDHAAPQRPLLPHLPSPPQHGEAPERVATRVARAHTVTCADPPAKQQTKDPRFRIMYDLETHLIRFFNGVEDTTDQAFDDTFDALVPDFISSFWAEWNKRRLQPTPTTDLCVQPMLPSDLCVQPALPTDLPNRRVQPACPADLRVQPAHANLCVQRTLPSDLRVQPALPTNLPNLCVQPASPADICVQPARPADLRVQPTRPTDLRVQPARPANLRVQPTLPTDMRLFIRTTPGTPAASATPWAIREQIGQAAKALVKAIHQVPTGFALVPKGPTEAKQLHGMSASIAIALNSRVEPATKWATYVLARTPRTLSSFTGNCESVTLSHLAQEAEFATGIKPVRVAWSQHGDPTLPDHDAIISFEQEVPPFQMFVSSARSRRLAPRKPTPRLQTTCKF